MEVQGRKNPNQGPLITAKQLRAIWAEVSRGGELRIGVKEKTAIVVDDGIATGATIFSTLEALKGEG